MTATPPEAEAEYSRGSGTASARQRRAQSRSAGGGGGAPERPPGPLRAGILIAALLGGLLLLSAEFTTLFDVTEGATVIRSVSTGSHQGWALVPVALLAGLLGVAVWRAGSRPALLAIGLLGLIALLVALLGDLPDAKATGLVLRGGHYARATSSPSVGLYMETLGAVILLIGSVCGFLMLEAPTPVTGRRRRDSTETS
jgi:hypothetical protein